MTGRAPDEAAQLRATTPLPASFSRVQPKQPFASEDLRSPRRRAHNLIARALDRALEPAGFHVTSRHFYSPIPERGSLPNAFWETPGRLPGIACDPERQIAFLERELARFLPEFTPPQEFAGRANAFFQRNGLYQGGDADLLYAMVRRFQPRRVIELGAGYSTLVTASACEVNRAHGHESEFRAYDPYASRPDAAIPGLSRLEVLAAERIPLASFEELAEDDVLFIDSSHVVKVGGDVSFLVLEVLPRLRPGVIVHFHDIFLPWHYPREWVEHNRWYWAEQYLLQAFLALNAEFEILLAAHALARIYPARFKELIPNYDPSVPPLAFWMRRNSVGRPVNG